MFVRTHTHICLHLKNIICERACVYICASSITCLTTRHVHYAPSLTVQKTEPLKRTAGHGVAAVTKTRL